MTDTTKPARIIALETYDIRFPTSRQLDGSDAMNPDPDYSAEIGRASCRERV